MQITGHWCQRATLLVVTLGLFSLISLSAVLSSPILAQEWTYTVKAGDTLWDLSEELLLQRSYWRRLQELNQVVDPQRLPPGKELRIPTAWLRMSGVAAQLAAVQGQAEVVRRDGTSEPAAAGLRLSSGDVLRTRPEASATVEFSDGARVLVEAETSLELSEIRAFVPLGIGSNRIELRSGGVDVKVPAEKGRAGTRFQIRTRAATLAVRGTDYRVRAPLDEPTAVEVVQGAVAATGAGRTRLVRERFGTLIGAGGAPSAPQRLLDPPDLAALPDIIERVPVQFAISALAGAAAYRVQIAPDERFTILLFDDTLATAQLVGPDLPDGEYVLRVRGIDRRGLQGLDAVRRFTLNARPEPPFVLAPLAESVVRSALPSFQWTQVERARAYRFQLARGADFAAPLVALDDHGEASFTPPQPLAAGDYYWRVALVADAGEQGPFSDPIPFEVRPAPEAPTLEPPQFDPEGAVLRWRAGLPGQRYQFQLAKDYWFEEVLVDEELSEPQIRLPPLPSNRYYLRLRTIDSDGYRPEFGPRQTLTVPLEQPWRALIIPALFLLLAL